MNKKTLRLGVLGTISRRVGVSTSTTMQRVNIVYVNRCWRSLIVLGGCKYNSFQSDFRLLASPYFIPTKTWEAFC